ncbi:alanine racemase [Sphingomonas sp. BIUV-7]|uniref:Alanine racemase n=1 Tax=Sphingomonas natans TaxID=3063330 RepID=A0ABT8Y3Z8_9SPHN|nr:alanine racemase [Sphingomonas sp. BIUV-7]MDO6413042.1 alanine racemase [Sphingomonas sp. BIUV-7]
MVTPDGRAAIGRRVSAPLRLDLDGAALVANWRWLAARTPGAACGAAIKADGYGLGARAVMTRLAAAGCRDFFVATWDEAERLGTLPKGVALSVLHGPREADMAVALAHPARPVLNTAEQVRRWRVGGGGACDVMVDTGMNRLGLSVAEATSGLLDGLGIETLMSHLACADEPEHPMNARQLGAFAGIAGRIGARRRSLANSAGVLLGPDYGFDLTRPGLALYGGIAAPGSAGIAPVVSVSAQILQLREIAAGESVGYGATWTAKRPTRVAIANIGYADGFLRALGPSGMGRIADAALPVIGRVSMDLLAFDATDADGAGEGEWIALDYDLPRLAKASGLSQYELLTGLGDRFERRWR